ncbi:MAG: cytochrome P450 [Acidimicrobiales bacterium]|jgi:cytochrome P450|nr:cytochrome [Acidimicrobiaceae bacterium]MDP6161238.1 cytochrome P450 [Acidimicrobiales bacterium]HJL91699.1 cytochrome P450 [Acidimicrobiales bacterium]HJO41336.1 cytochrome P450 [Acidimicrobiales bacterium]
MRVDNTKPEESSVESHKCPVTTSFMDHKIQSEPWEFIADLHERCPVHQVSETGVWLIVDHEASKEALLSPEIFSSQVRAASGHQAEMHRLHQEILSEEGWGHVMTLQRTDPPVHTRYRKLVNRVFTPRRVAAMAANIDEIANELISNFIDSGECEFMSEFALPLPGTIIAEQLGLDRSQISTFKKWADAMLAPAMRLLTEEEVREVANAELEAQKHFDEIFEQRRKKPEEDLMSALVHSHQEGEEPLTNAELQNLMHQLITGGFETTTSALAHGVWLLIEYPDQQKLLRSSPELIEKFVEEALRFWSPVQGLARMTTQDTEVCGTTIPEGSVVSVRYGAANRDPKEFENPEVFDINREDISSHLAFGLGAHFCPGASLARQQLKSAFTALLERTEWFEFAKPLPDPAHEPSFFLLPVEEMHLKLT